MRPLLISPIARGVAAACAALALAATASAQRLKVYVLAGQSNMQGHAKLSTLDYLADDPETAALLSKLRDEHGEPRVIDDVWIAYRTGDGDGEAFGPLTAGYGARRDVARSDDKLGPELTFGLRVAEAHDGPVLLIKAAWGGRSLHTDFRPPSAGPFEFSQQQLDQLKQRGDDIDEARRAKEAATGKDYRQVVAYVRAVLGDLPRYCPQYDPQAGYDLAGFVWFQGWNDMVDRGVYPERDREGGYARYSECLAHFIRDMRRDLEAPSLPFVIGVMGVGGEGPDVSASTRNFRAAMAAPAQLEEFVGNVVAVPTAPYWDAPLAAIAARLDEVREFERKLRNKQKGSQNEDGALGEDEQRAAVARFRAERLTPEDEAVWLRGASNAGYHYLGCGKTLARIGVAFADAVLRLEPR
ncbi:MAG: sialate O-acetylesterase [Planctomycetota bacterium]